MKFNPSVSSFLLALVGALSGWIAWWINKLKFERQQSTQAAVAAAEKALNDRRDFNHLVNNQIQISNGIANGFKDLESIIDSLKTEVLEMKAYLIRYGVTADEEVPRRRKSE